MKNDIGEFAALFTLGKLYCDSSGNIAVFFKDVKSIRQFSLMRMRPICEKNFQFHG